MTHMSQYSYLDRMVPTYFLMFLYFFVIYVNDKFMVFSPASLTSGQTRPYIIIILILSLVSLAITDTVTVVIKYEEGWTCFPDGGYAAASSRGWKPHNLALKPVADATWNLALILKSAGCFLLNTMWGFICSSQFGGDPLPKFELIFLIVASVVSVAMVFILQNSFPGDPFFSGVIPQYYVSFTILCISALTFVSYMRFVKLSKKMIEGSSLAAQVDIYKKANFALFWVFFIEALMAFFGVILPTLGVKAKVTDLHKNVFINDFSTRIMNFLFLLGYCILLFLLYPPKLQSGGHGKSKGGASKGGASKSVTKNNKVTPEETV